MRNAAIKLFEEIDENNNGVLDHQVTCFLSRWPRVSFRAQWEDMLKCLASCGRRAGQITSREDPRLTLSSAVVADFVVSGLGSRTSGAHRRPEDQGVFGRERVADPCG